MCAIKVFSRLGNVERFETDNITLDVWGTWQDYPPPPLKKKKKVCSARLSESWQRIFERMCDRLQASYGLLQSCHTQKRPRYRYLMDICKVNVEEEENLSIAYEAWNPCSLVPYSPSSSNSPCGGEESSVFQASKVA